MGAILSSQKLERDGRNLLISVLTLFHGAFITGHGQRQERQTEVSVPADDLSYSCPVGQVMA